MARAVLEGGGVAAEKHARRAAGKGEASLEGRGPLAPQYGFLALVGLLTVMAHLSTGPVACASGAPFSYLHPRVEFEEGWNSRLVVVNLGQTPGTVTLLAYDVGGNLLGEFGRGLVLAPGGRRLHSRDDGAWPRGTASLKVESDAPLLSFVILERSDGKALEAILPAMDPGETLTFPVVSKLSQRWNYLVLLNAGSAETAPQAVALDREGKWLGRAPLPSLAPMASTTAVVTDLFDATTLSSAAAITVTADQPLAGFQLFGTWDRSDLAVLPGKPSLGRALFVPVFRQEGGVGLWTVVGLINPRDDSISITIEAFDDQGRSLGRLPGPASVPGRGSHSLLTANIGGSLPPNTASLGIVSDGPVTAYAVVGALYSQGLTALGALAEDAVDFTYGLIGSDDGHVLAAVPLTVSGGESLRSAFESQGAGYWSQEVRLPGRGRASGGGNLSHPGRQASVAMLTFVVDSLDDTNAYDDPHTPEDERRDGICADKLGNCTLRAALEEADRMGLPASITFSLTGTIALTKSSPGWVFCMLDVPSGSTIVGPGVTVDDSSCPLDYGFVFSMLDNTRLRGLTVKGRIAGVWMLGRGSIIEGLTITGATNVGVSASSGNTIGGTAPGARNIISGNGVGVVLWGDGNVVLGNYIGTDATGRRALGNSHGVYVYGNENVIGGASSSARNVISGNSGSGVIIGFGHSIRVIGNYIGTDATGVERLGNGGAGIIIGLASGNTIGGTASAEGNIIAFNGSGGVLIDGGSVGGSRNAIRGNSIFSNTLLGVDLAYLGIPPFGVNPNDLRDEDSGPNDLQNFPELTALSREGQTSIEGRLNSTPSTKFALEFFANKEPDPSEQGQGERFLGSMTVTTDGTGNATFTFPAPLSPGEFITATATDPNGNTSEFSCALGDGPDPLLKDQWHLRSRSEEPAGANVQAIWPSTKGKGVVIGVLDDGLQHSHCDLQPNYTPSLSKDFTDNDEDPSPVTDGPCGGKANCHGTAVAGVAAARGGNGIGVSGVAPLASLAGLRLVVPEMQYLLDDFEITKALRHAPDAIHILNNSWGPPDDGRTLARPYGETEQAIKAAAEQGRGGKGRIFTWAAGNGFKEGDNCNFDGFANSRFVIAVGAVDRSAARAEYSEPCSALFVTAPSSDRLDNPTPGWGITTTDLAGLPGYSAYNYTQDFGGTSAAAPVVSGVAALMLARNPSLSWRDVKHILARSSVKVDGDDPGWVERRDPMGLAPKLYHNEKYGFGLVDAQAAVNLAATWSNVSAETDIPAITHTITQTIPDDDPDGLTDSITIGSSFANFIVEHVEVVFHATHPYRGDLAVTLTSPGGVASHLATVRPDDSGDDFPSWRFGSVRHWGESAAGRWTLRVADLAPEHVGTWNSWTLRIFGTQGLDTVPPDTSILTGPEGPIPGTSATFTWTGSDDRTPVGNLLYAFRLHPLEPSFSPFGTATSKSYTSLAPGPYTFYVKAKDEAGNEDPSPASRSFSASVNFPLTVTKAGTGSGIVISTPPGIDCGTDCIESYPYNTSVTLTATPATGSTFTGWSGEGCSGTGTCTVTMTQARNVTATFTLQTFNLTVNKAGTGSGTVTSNPPGIDCGTDCSERYAYDTPVTLTATPSPGSVFTRWEGDCTGTSPTCSVRMTQARNVTTVFTRQNPSLTLSVNQSAFHRAQQLTLGATVTPGATPVTADVYVALQLPDGSLLFLQRDWTFTWSLQPILRSWTIAPFAGQIFSYIFGGGEPVGNYAWLAAFTQPGTLNFIGPIVSAPFSFTP